MRLELCGVALKTGEEETVPGDAGYIGADKRETAIVRNKQGKKIKYEINRRPSQLNKLNRYSVKTELRFLQPFLQNRLITQLLGELCGVAYSHFDNG